MAIGSEELGNTEEVVLYRCRYTRLVSLSEVAY